jgi:hypothetical protein
LQAAQPKSQSRALPVDRHHAGLTQPECDTGTAGVVGGAVGTAAAIATSPIGGDEYARRNGFVCTPGTWFRGEDGRRYLCQ